MARPTKLTQARLELIVTLLERGMAFASACRSAGVSSSAAYEWIDRGRGVHPTRPATRACVEFAKAVDAVFPGGFAERHTPATPHAHGAYLSLSRLGAAEQQRPSGNGGNA
jgi:hypothetical protein